MAKTQSQTIESLRAHLSVADGDIQSARRILDDASSNMTMAINIRKKIQNTLDGLLLSEFGKDWNWILSDPNNTSDVKMKALHIKFASVHDSINFGGYLNHETNQWCVQLKLSRGRLDEVKNCYDAFCEVFPFVKPISESIKAFNIFDHNFNERCSYSLVTGISIEDPCNIVERSYSSKSTTLYTGTLFEMIQKIHDKFYYEDIND